MKLTHRTLFFIILPIVIFVLVMTSINYVIVSEHLINSTINEVRSLSQITSYEMKNPMYNLDVDRLNEIIDALEVQEEVQQVLVLFPDGRVLTDGTDEDYNYGNVLHDDFITESIIADKETILVKNDLIRISIPISLNESIGMLSIDYSLELLNNKIQQSFVIPVLISFTLIVAFAIVSIFFSRSITSPIFKIREMVEKISQGKYESNSESFNIPEIQKLNEGIDEMYKKLNQFQNELAKKERLATIGEFSARIAHDLRNPLTSLVNSVDLIKHKNPELVKQNMQYFDHINSSINQIQLEINGVLNHTKIRPLQKSNSKFSNLLENSLTSLNIPKNIKIVYPNNDAEIFCDAKQIENVLSNLIGNSQDSINKEQGEIVITLDEEDDFHEITISDNGIGIPPENIESIFEPLFTTKQYGSGLGLVNCKNIIQEHNGKIFATHLQKGTMFTIQLPKS